MSPTLTRLANGLTVISHSMPGLETVALGLWVAAGSRDERPQEAGAAHFLEHMAFKGTRRRGPLQIAAEIEDRGGDLNAATSTETTGYTAHVLKEDWRTALDVICDIVTDPLFDAAEMERERAVILQEIAAARDDPADLVFEQAEAVAFGDNPLGRSVLGDAATVERLSAQDLRAFRARNYGAARMVLCAAGAVDHDALAGAAESLLGALDAGAAAARATPSFTAGRCVRRRPQEQSHVVLAWPAPGYLDDGLHAMQALSSILGGGMTSRLFRELREERGLCYSTYSHFSAWADIGLVYLYAATAPRDAAAAESLMAELARRMAAGVSAQELSRACAQGRAGLLMSLESPAARAGQMARQYLAYGRVPPVSEFVSRMEAVTAADVATLAERTFCAPPVVSIVEGGT